MPYGPLVVTASDGVARNAQRAGWALRGSALGTVIHALSTKARTGLLSPVRERTVLAR